MWATGTIGDKLLILGNFEIDFRSLKSGNLALGQFCRIPGTLFTPGLNCEPNRMKLKHVPTLFFNFGWVPPILPPSGSGDLVLYCSCIRINGRPSTGTFYWPPSPCVRPPTKPRPPKVMPLPLREVIQSHNKGAGTREPGKA